MQVQAAVSAQSLMVWSGSMLLYCVSSSKVRLAFFTLSGLLYMQNVSHLLPYRRVNTFFPWQAVLNLARKGQTLCYGLINERGLG